MNEKHWSKTELLHQTVTHPNIIVKGTHSYYSDCWDHGFERSVVRYLHGDAVSQQWHPLGSIDQLLIGDYVCIGAEAVILMGGNHTHRIDWLSLYPFMASIQAAYQPKGDTRLGDGCWIGMRAMLMPGVTIGEGAVVAAGSIVTADVEPYTIVGGNPARPIKRRFSPQTIARLLALRIYDLSTEEFVRVQPLLADDDITALERAIAEIKR
ncbi:Chloramphenicol acetyltransferase [Serratia quinivorans]|uniref:CatB-related O-acetyltransferase n=1 Tax=Serratia quinivorans TaxID=137545 RepID=UPI00217AE546|nr:CatB-related O-acetyltransferase [Serratia quinivorans]CAI1176734.1 Chloramphenicol acetyltransferase [Serratia quinivorans]